MENSINTTTRILIPIKKKSLKNIEEKEEIKEEKKDYYTIYFIESHPKNEDEEIEILIDTSNKYLKQLKKINYKEKKDIDNKEFIFNVYSINLKYNLIKKKEIKESDKSKTINIKIYLKKNKNKFESINTINIEEDNFLIDIKFETLKGWFGKELIPPEQFELSNIEIIRLFNESLLIKEKKRIMEQSYLKFLEFGINLLKKSGKYELESFLILFINILNGDNYLLIKNIFELFEIERLITQKAHSSLLQYQDKLDNLYKNQSYVFDKIEVILQNNIYDKNLEYYLIKFYTIYIYYIYTLGLYQYLEEILKNLRDSNKYNKLILPLLYLSDYHVFYKDIPISKEIKNSLINKLIDASKTYLDLIKSFNLINDYINKDFTNILSIIIDNYDKINEICFKEKKCIELNEYIKINNNDDLSKIKEYLNIFNKKINEYNYKAINIDKDIWNFYLNNFNNIEFFIYIKSFIIQTSLKFNDIENSFFFISRYNKKNFIDILEIIVKHYNKIYNICYKEQKQINIQNYIIQTINDDQNKLKEHLLFILCQKKEKKNEIIYFDNQIFNFYVENNYSFDFLIFLESILYTNSIKFKDIHNSLKFTSKLKNKQMIPLLEIIIKNVDNILSICKNENTIINIEQYISKDVYINEDLRKIKEFISIIVNKEKIYLYNAIKFDIKIWLPFLDCEDLDKLKLIKKMILICKEIDNTLDYENINLDKKIHDIGFDLIKKEELIGEKLILFLGEDEVFYTNKKYIKLEKENKLIKEKNNELNDKINYLIEKNKCLKNKVEENEKKFFDTNDKMNTRIKELNKENDNLKNKITKMEKYFSILEKKIESIKNNNNE